MKNDSMNNQQGSLLLESMVALAVFSIGLLGLASIQTRVLAAGSSAYYRSIAADIAADLADRIDANRSPFAVPAGSDTTGVPAVAHYDDTALPCTGGSCATASAEAGYATAAVAKADKEEFLKSIKQLPNASSTVARANGRYTVSISWTDNTRWKSGDSGASQATFSVEFPAP